MPDNVYNIENNVLLGFKDGIDLSQYKDTCDTMQIPANVTSIFNYAFYYNQTTTKIPSFIKNLTFAKGSKCNSIGTYAFPNSFSLISVDFSNCSQLFSINDVAFSECSSINSIDFSNCTRLSSICSSVFQDCSSLTSVTFSSSLTSIGGNAFLDCLILNDIKWNLHNEYQTQINIGSSAFQGISTTGVVKSLNTSIASSQDLLDWIKTKGSFPQTGWRTAD